MDSDQGVRMSLEVKYKKRHFSSSYYDAATDELINTVKCLFGRIVIYLTFICFFEQIQIVLNLSISRKMRGDKTAKFDIISNNADPIE